MQVSVCADGLQASYRLPKPFAQRHVGSLHGTVVAGILLSMTTQQILKELPKLSQQERHKIAKRLFELEEDREALEFAAQATDLAFQGLDKAEENDAGSAPR